MAAVARLARALTRNFQTAAKKEKQRTIKSSVSLRTATPNLTSLSRGSYHIVYLRKVTFLLMLRFGALIL